MKEYDNYDFNDDLGYEEIDDEDYYQDQHYGNGEFYGNDDMNPGMSNNQKINMGLNVDRLSFDDIDKTFKEAYYAQFDVFGLHILKSVYFTFIFIVISLFFEKID